MVVVEAVQVVITATSVRDCCDAAIWPYSIMPLV